MKANIFVYSTSKLIKEYQSIHCWGLSSQCLLAAGSKDCVMLLGVQAAARLALGKGEGLEWKINLQLMLVN